MPNSDPYQFQEKTHIELRADTYTLPSPQKLADKLSSKGLLGGNAGSRWRFATHYGIEANDIDEALNIIELSLGEL